jgi:hypothetical protein
MAVASNLRRTRIPVIRKGGSSILPFKVAIVGWIDLLGLWQYDRGRRLQSDRG